VAELRAITAIRSVEQEGFIAASLMNLGWRVLYRATSPLRLQEELENYPDAALFLSDDFFAYESLSSKNLFLLRGRSFPLGRVGESDPRTTFELEEFIRSAGNSNQSKITVYPATQSKVIAIMSAEGKIGATTFAINLADQLSISGERVLLVDCDLAHFSIAQHFEVHDIRGKVREIHPHLSLFEVSERSHLESLAAVAATFDSIVIDLGRIQGLMKSGARLLDLLITWMEHSHALALFSTGNSKKSIERSLSTAENLSRCASGLKVEFVAHPDSVLSRGDRKALAIHLTDKSGNPCEIFTRDRRAVQLCEESHSTLSVRAPKSTLTREISQFVVKRISKVSVG
jgi:cellulose biosynthesis protein BcsQ